MKEFSREQIETEVTAILAEELQVDASRVKAVASMQEDLQADSIDAVDITLALERRFGINITDRQMSDIVRGTVADVFGMVERKVREGGTV